MDSTEATPRRRRAAGARYSRTKWLYEDFLTAFYQADLLIVTDVYAAGEDPIEGASSERLVEGIRDHGHREVVYRSSLEETADYLAEVVETGDLVVTMGAGNVNQVCDLLAARLKERK